MRPKSFKGKLCAYCAESVCESADHVFAREFFPQDDRGNTPKVPACNRCNNLKAELERYATCTLPFGSRHPTALKVMEEKMPRRLKENLHTRRELLEGQGRVLVHEPDGHLLSVTTFTVDATKIAELMRYVVQGLIWHHWGFYLKRAETEIGILTARVEGDGITRAVFDGLLGRYIGIALHARQDLGNGTARYEGVGVQVPDQPVVSIWRLQLLDSIYSVPGGPAKGFLISTTPRGAGFGSGIPVPVPSNKKG
jgi:hypothetical protein